MEKEVLNELKKLKITYTHYTHPVFSSCEISDTYHQKEKLKGVRAKNLFLRNKNGKKHFLLLLPHHREYEKARFKELSDQKCGFASADRMQTYLGVQPGSVSPFGLLNDKNKEVIVYIDDFFFSQELIHLHPNRNDQSIAIQPTDLEKVLTHWGYEIQKISF